MRNQAIVIGINTYRYSNNLSHAQNDAEYIREFLLKEAGFEEVWYFSDNSPAIEGKSTEPIRSNLLTVLEHVSEDASLSGINNFWFFFAGHGIPHDGNDYLLMADSNPDLPKDTAIATNLILQKLKSSGAENVVMFLDACRSTGTRDGRGIGKRTTAEVQKIADTVCFFACSPNEFSLELDDYKHGAFTYALVEGLGIQEKLATVDKLEHFLKLRVRELTKDRQNPRVVNDSKDKHLILMPKYADKKDILPLKNDALNAQFDGDLMEARRLWMKVLAIDGTDYEAITKIENLAVIRAGLTQQTNSFISVQERRDTAPQKELKKFRLEKELTLDLGQGITLDLVQIPAGKFMMGSNDYDTEKPIHEVTVQSFLMGKYVVTNTQWFAVMGTKPAEKYDVKFQGEKQPVVGVSWDDCVEFCKKLSSKLGKNIRLPSEAEWEYACRANTTTPFHFGATITTDLVNYNGNYPYGDAPKGEYRQKTVDVGSFSPNAFGLYNMHGNVWEWCSDRWHENYKNAPQDSSSWETGTVDNTRVLRGGSWGSDAILCRSAYRSWGYADVRNNGIGFRLVVS